MLIQCREPMFAEICDLMAEKGLVPQLQDNSPGGYIDCFDKDWYFLEIGDEHFDIQQLIISTHSNISVNESVIGYSDMLFVYNVTDGDQHLYMRGITGKCQISCGFKSHLIFVKES